VNGEQGSHSKTAWDELEVKVCVRSCPGGPNGGEKKSNGLLLGREGNEDRISFMEGPSGPVSTG